VAAPLLLSPPMTQAMTQGSLLQVQRLPRLASRPLVHSCSRGWEAAYWISLRTKLPSSKARSLGRW